jgi:hypothetical protein
MQRNPITSGPASANNLFDDCLFVPDAAETPS